MENELYKLMISNANNHIASQDLANPKAEDFTIFQISEVLALLTCKLKEDIVMDIINFDRQLIFSERVNLFYSIWGMTKVRIPAPPTLEDITRNFNNELQLMDKFEDRHIAFYFNMSIDDKDWKVSGVSLSREELKSYIDSGYTDTDCADGFYSLEQKIIQVMNFQKVPTHLQQVKVGENNQTILLNQY